MIAPPVPMRKPPVPVASGGNDMFKSLTGLAGGFMGSTGGLPSLSDGGSGDATAISKAESFGRMENSFSVMGGGGGESLPSKMMGIGSLVVVGGIVWLALK